MILEVDIGMMACVTVGELYKKKSICALLGSIFSRQIPRWEVPKVPLDAGGQSNFMKMEDMDKIAFKPLVHQTLVLT